MDQSGVAGVTHDFLAVGLRLTSETGGRKDRFGYEVAHLSLSLNREVDVECVRQPDDGPGDNDREVEPGPEHISEREVYYHREHKHEDKRGGH